jgi:hypothetical protein
VTLPFPTVIEVNVAPPASATVGTALPLNSVVWLLKDAAGQILPDVPTTMTASSGGSVVGSHGSGEGGAVQAATWTLGTQAGDQTLQLLVTGTTLSSTVHIQATPGPAANLIKISGDNQTGPAETGPDPVYLDSLLVVRLVDQYQNGIDDVPISWQACEGGPALADTTSAGGYSAVLQRTGPVASNPTFCTRATAAGFSVDFTYTVTAAAATSAGAVRTNQRALPGTHGPAPVSPSKAFNRPRLH